MDSTTHVLEALTADVAILTLEERLAALERDIAHHTQVLINMCVEKGVLLERIRAVQVVVKVGHEHRPQPETTHAMQNLHKVNRVLEYEGDTHK
jgi:hypothetical protein